MKLFWLLFILALLFVIGSASLMRYFDHQALTRKTENKNKHEEDD